MQRNALQMLAIVALVVLAGCTGGLPGGDGSTDTTAEAPTLEDVSYPAGVSENGTNVSALADAHSASLENESFTLDLDVTVNSSTANQSVRLDAAVGPSRDEVHIDASAMGQEMSTYLTAEKKYTRLRNDGGTSYRVAERTADAVKLVPSSFAGTSYLDRFGGVGNFTPTGVREVNGTTLLVLRADGSDATATESNVTAAESNVTEYDATILVDEQGVVRSMTVDVTSTRDGRRFHTRFSMRISDVGETAVAEPSWLDEARNETGS